MAKYTPIPAAPGMFRSALVPAAAVCLGIGALLGLGAMLCLPDPQYARSLTEKILRSGIRTQSALDTWTLIHHVVALVCFLGPAITALCMCLAMTGRGARGMNLLSNGAQWLLRIVHVTAAMALALFLYRAIRYLISISRRQDWLYQLFATFVMEGLMVAQAVFLYRLLCRFLDDCVGCAASIGYTLSSGKLDPGSIPAFTATGLTLLGILGLVLTADRLVTMTIASDGIRQFYKFIWSEHPGQWLCAGSLFFGAMGDLLLSGYLRFFKHTSERAVFFATRTK